LPGFDGESIGGEANASAGGVIFRSRPGEGNACSINKFDRKEVKGEGFDCEWSEQAEFIGRDHGIFVGVVLIAHQGEISFYLVIIQEIVFIGIISQQQMDNRDPRIETAIEGYGEISLVREEGVRKQD
jgi:hypothetical protein